MECVVLKVRSILQQNCFEMISAEILLEAVQKSHEFSVSMLKQQIFDESRLFDQFAVILWNLVHCCLIRTC